MTITELAIKRPSLIIVIFLTLALLGYFGYTQLQYELLPDINIPIVSIVTVYPGASAKEVETGVSKLIEDAVSTLDKVDGVYTTSQESVSVVVIEFTQDAKIDFAIQDAQRKINQILNSLPTGADVPAISKISINEQPVLRIGARSDLDEREFYQLLKERINARFSRIAGVGLVSVTGGQEREIKVNIDSQKARSYGISLLQVTQAVNMANLDFPAGRIKDTDGQFVVRLAGKFNNLEELKNMIVGRSRAGANIRLGEIAEIEDGRRDAATLSRIDGKPSLGILIQKQTDANAVTVCRAVRDELAKLEKEYANINLKFDVTQDASIFTIESARAVWEDLGIAILLVAAVMLLFLHSLRNSIIVLVAIPSSLITTFIAMWAFGFTMNMITLLALSLVIGILVDDSIVVLENIYRHLENGEPRRSAALKGRNEIGFTALSITLVDVVVFVPLSLVTGTIGGIMRDFSVMVVVATLTSLFVSFTLTPLLASRFGKLEDQFAGSLMGRFGRWFERQYDRVKRFYVEILQWSLRPKRWLIIFGLAVLAFGGAISLVAFDFIGSEFVPQADRNEFIILLELPSGVRLEESSRAARRVEEILARIPEVKKVFTSVGSTNNAFSDEATSSANLVEINVALLAKQERKRSTEAVSQEVRREVLQQLPGIKCRISPVTLWGTSDGAPISMGISGSDWDEVSAAAQKVMAVIKTIPGTADVKLSSEQGQPEMQVEIDREKLAALGLTMAEVGQALRVGLTGDDTSKFRAKDGTEYTTRILLDPLDRSQTATLGELTFINHSGDPIALKQFARITPTLGPTKLQRRDRNYSITVSSQAVGRPSGTISADIDQALTKEKLPPGIRLSYYGDVEQQQKSFASLGLALLAAIVFVYLIMVALYNSFLHPLVVLFAVPLAIIGALLALALTMNTLNIFSILGIIMQVGLVSKNAILLVDMTNKLRAEGHSVQEALLEAGRERLRPILMTTLTMIFGMLPIALSTAAAGEFKQGLGWALIGGLTFSMFMTLILVPVVYVKVEQIRAFMLRLRRRIFGMSDDDTELAA
jgi:HAE1 family hydrophobic/amphiphilic exporter-1